MWTREARVRIEQESSQNLHNCGEQTASLVMV
jgi:hypothetical protein